MTISYQGGANPAAQGVPGLYVNVQAPPAAALAGAPANILGIVGTASWGPVNSPVRFGDYASGAAAFGDMKARKYDLMTQVAAAYQQGANNFVGVRVTDGTDAAATVAVQTNCITLTAKYTGTRGNSLVCSIGPGTAASSFKATITMPGLQPETFDNLTGTGNAFWVALAAAINAGQSTNRPASALVTATAGVGVTAPATANYTLTGGTDGVTTITGAVLIGADTTPRTGMYALRNTGTAAFLLADCDTSTTWTTQQAFGISELTEPFCVSPAGDTIANFTTTMNTAGIDNPWCKVIFGDWVYMVDGVNNVTRLVSPQGFLAGKKIALGPHNSVLNKPLAAVAGTQKSTLNQTYSNAELQAIAAARGDVIVMNSIGGNYASAAFGRNSSSDPGRRQDVYTTMTDYLVSSLNASAGLGAFVGRLITPTEMREAASCISAFLQNEVDAGRIDSFSVQVDGNNNPASQTKLGVQKATVLVTYLSVLEYFLVDFTGGQTVVSATAQALAA